MASKPKPSPAEIAAKLVPLAPQDKKVPPAQKQTQEKQIDAAVLAAAPDPIKAHAPDIVSPKPEPAQPKAEPVSPTPAPVAPKLPEPKHSGFLAWLATREGEEASDPRWFPESPSRRQGEIERRLRVAWDAARA